ncbi:MAG: tellurite resistance/C4-dicarboxylate transporter family protein [Phycisphaerales bacterium]|nr:tellurite resistance/C4-dicarboxylate transporter family protein [Phycisphaerales bacterium]
MKRIADNVRRLSPAYFALVMATGIIGIALHQIGLRALSIAFLSLNVVQYLVLWVLTLWRIIRYPKEFGADLIGHQSGPGFFTVVAGTCILGSQSILVAHAHFFAFFLWGLGIALWVALTYFIFAAFTIKENKPSLDQGISGAWLLAVVATQAIAVLSALLASRLPQPDRLHVNFLALSMWLWGGMMYIWMISLIFYRYAFFRFSPNDLSPPYWINMGAMAISTLAGARLIENAADAWFLESLRPFIKGFTIFYWATGTWWIPMLLILAVWRHVYKRFPLYYDPLYWGAVFPLGMYTVSTLEMDRSMRLDFMYVLPRVFIYVAVGAWMLTFYGMLRSIFRVFRSKPAPIDP